MNVNLNTSLNANRLTAMSAKSAEDGAIVQEKVANQTGLLGPSLKVTVSEVSQLDTLEDLAGADLRRDDDLGQLMAKAFDFQPPEMPNFV